VHSYEEDTQAERVFRPANYRFPPSRGRLSFELEADGSAVLYGIGPTDRVRSSEGRWRLDDDRLVLTYAHSDAEQVSEIVSASPDRLVVRK
jgi:hypothetical protein